MGLRIDAGMGFAFAQNPEIDEIATYFDTMDSGSEIKASSLFTQPVLGVFYRFNDTLSAGLEGRMLSRSHNMNNSFSDDDVSTGITGYYDYDPFEFTENYTIIMGKLNYALLQKPAYTIELDGGLGIYMGSMEKSKELSFELKQDSTPIYSFDYEESLTASASGIFGSIGGNFRVRLTDRISAFLSADLNYFFPSTWTGDYSYNLPEDTDTSGELFFVTYDQEEKYLWVLDDGEVDELEDNDDYEITSPDFLTLHLNFSLSVGISIRF